MPSRTYGSRNVELHDLVRALFDYDPLAARQWVADAIRCDLDWANIEQPRGLTVDELSLAAGLAELLSSRAGKTCPAWAGLIGPSLRPILLVQAAETMPRLRKLCEEEGPLPLRRRGFLASPDFLAVA